MDYSTYLRTQSLLSLQAPRSRNAGPELFFILAHQAAELWLKALIFNLEAAEAQLADVDVDPSEVLPPLRRAESSATELTSSTDALRCLTADEFRQFRDALGTASGAQSHQFAHLHRITQPGAATQLEMNLAARLSERDLPIALELLPINGDLSGMWFEVVQSLRSVGSLIWRWHVCHLDMVRDLIGRDEGTGGTRGLADLLPALADKPFPTVWDSQYFAQLADTPLIGAH